jgi:hypothetical protein
VRAFSSTSDAGGVQFLDFAFAAPDMDRLTLAQVASVTKF